MKPETKAALMDPLIDENPITFQLLGLCSAMAVTTSLWPALLMSMAVTAVLSVGGAVIKDAAREPYGARALMYSLVLDGRQAVRDRQLQQLQNHADPDVYTLTIGLMAEMDGLEAKYGLPLIDIAVPALKQLSVSQYESFKRNLLALIEMDSRIELLEWSLQKFLFSHLDAQFFKLPRAKAVYSRPEQVKEEIALILSVMARAGQRNPGDVEKAFQSAVQVLGLGGLLAPIAGKDISLSSLDQALGKVSGLKPLVKPRLLKACVASIVHDQRVSAVEMELLRAFSGVLDCPMPPVPHASSA